MGVSFMPRVLIDDRRLRDSIGVHKVPPRFAKVSTMLVWHKDAEHHAAREAFFEVMQDAGSCRVGEQGRQRRRAAV